MKYQGIVIIILYLDRKVSNIANIHDAPIVKITPVPKFAVYL